MTAIETARPSIVQKLDSAIPTGTSVAASIGGRSMPDQRKSAAWLNQFFPLSTVVLIVERV